MKDCITRLVPSNRYDASDRERARPANGATQTRAQRSAFLIRARKSRSFPSPANEFQRRYFRFEPLTKQQMKTKLITTIAAIALLPLAGFAQTPPPPPGPPPPPPGPPDRHEKMPKVPVTFLGVET